MGPSVISSNAWCIECKRPGSGKSVVPASAPMPSKENVPWRQAVWEGSSQRLCCCYLLNICPKTRKQNTTGLHILFNYGIHMIRCQVRIVFKHTIDFIDTRSEMQEVYFIMKTFEKTSKCYRSVAQLICSLQRQYACSLIKFHNGMPTSFTILLEYTYDWALSQRNKQHMWRHWLRIIRFK